MRSDIINKIGNTPLIRLYGYERLLNTSCRIYAKLEWFNPFGSVKDRVAREVMSNIKSKDIHIVEATSGNLGISLSGLSDAIGIRCTIVMPENMSERRKSLIRSFGSELVLTSAKDGMSGSIATAKKISKELPNTYFVDQFNNYSSYKAHLNSTAPEIFSQLKKVPDAVISGIGSAGTVMGIAKFFTFAKTQTVGVVPDRYPHKIQGIGAGIPLGLLDTSLISHISKASFEDCEAERKALSSSDSIDAGISSGAVLHACRELIKGEDLQEKDIVLIFADGADRYQ